MNILNETTITLPDGYMGHTEAFCAEPLLVDGRGVKVAVAGREWLIRWTSIDEYRTALAASTGGFEAIREFNERFMTF